MIRPPSAPAMLGSSASMQSLQSSTEEGSHACHQPSRASLRRSASSGMLSGTRSSAPGTALGSRESRGALVASRRDPTYRQRNRAATGESTGIVVVRALRLRIWCSQFALKRYYVLNDLKRLSRLEEHVRDALSC